MPKVSVIIPVYNTEKYLEKCLESVCNQTLSDIEIICINDCSTDNSLDILKKYNVRIINLKENKGAAYARNIGIDNASGEYLGFVDSDDYIAPDFYEILYNNSNRADIIKGNILDADTTVITPFYDMNHKIAENKFYFYYGFTSAIYKRSFVQENSIKFPDGIKYFEDPYFSINAMIKCCKISLTDEAEYYYRDNTGSASKKLDTEDLKKVLVMIFEKLNNNDILLNDYLIVFDFMYNFMLNKINNDLNLVLQTIDLCKFENLKSEYFDRLINSAPSKFVPRILMKKRNMAYA